MNQALLSRKSDEWSTPDDTFRKLDEEFHFTLDAAATTENAKCTRFYTKENSGLTADWRSETVWCNPPYSQLAAWIKKAYEASKSGTTTVLLIPARTDTKAWHEYIIPHAQVRFIKGRLKFGGNKNSAPFPSAVVVFNAH